MRLARFDRRIGLRIRSDRGFFRRCGLGGLPFSAFAFQFDQRLSNFEVVALTNEDACDFPGGRRRHRHGGFVGLELDQGLSLSHLIALVDEHLNHVAAFNAFREEGQFHVHVSSLSIAGRRASVTEAMEPRRR